MMIEKDHKDRFCRGEGDLIVIKPPPRKIKKKPSKKRRINKGGKRYTEKGGE